MSRYDDLIKLVGDDPRNQKMVEYVVDLETRIDELIQADKAGEAPFYEVNPKRPQQQRVNATFKAYKEMLQQYTNCYKALFKVNDVDEDKSESPLRSWAKKRNAD